MPILLIFILVIIIATVIFAIQNTTVVPITFLVWEFSGSLALMLLLFFASGVIMGILASLPKIIKKGKVAKGHKQHINHLEERLRDNDSELPPPPTEHK